MELEIAGRVAGAIGTNGGMGAPARYRLRSRPDGAVTRLPSSLRSCVPERGHDLAREQIDGAQHLGQREVAEGELRHEVVGAGLLHL